MSMQNMCSGKVTAEYRGRRGHYKVKRKTKAAVVRVIKSVHASTRLVEWVFSQEDDDGED